MERAMGTGKGSEKPHCVTLGGIKQATGYKDVWGHEIWCAIILELTSALDGQHRDS